MSTTITFIGLFVVMLNSPSPPQIIMPDFPNLQPVHNRIIAYRPGDLVSASNWAPSGSFHYNGAGGDGQTYDYVDVSKENIHFITHTIRPTLIDATGLMPHLTCCCAAMKAGISDDYTSGATTSKKAANLLVDDGTLSTIGTAPSRIDTRLTVIAPEGIEIDGQEATTVRRLTLRPASTVLFVDTPLCAVDGTSCPTPTHSDFLQYYTMAKQANTCNALPATPDCPVVLTGCIIPLLKTRRFAVKRASHPIMIQRSIKLKAGTLIFDINCASSGWP